MEAEHWEDEELEELSDDEGEAPERKVRMRIVTDARQELLRIDRFLMNRLEGATRNKIQQALEDGNITVNGGVAKANYKVRPSDEIVVYDTRRVETTEVIPEPMALEIVYEDEHLMVVNKPAGIVVHPGCGNYSGTLINGLAWYLQQAGGNVEALARVGLVHRIDKDTTGLLVIAKTEEARSKLAAQFKKHTVHRRYWALVWGDPANDSGTIRAHVGRHQRFRKIFSAYPEGEHGKEATTHYHVLERFGYVTLVELHLETGRTHQIRVHMQYLGHPLFGDTTYGGDRIVRGTVFAKYKVFVENCFKILPRQALHAKELGFTHPATGEAIRLDCPLPQDIVDVVTRWRTYTTAGRGTV